MKFGAQLEHAQVIDGEVLGEFYDDWSAGSDEEWPDPRYGRVSTTTRPSIQYVNEAGIPEDVIDRHFRRGRGFREISSIIEKWTQDLNNELSTAPSLSLFNRSSRYKPSSLHIHAIMARTSWACDHDDILLTLGEVVEGLMWPKCKFELIEEDEQDFWNQWARRINLDAMLRAMGREDYKVSQFYVGLWWEKATFAVRDNAVEEKVQEFKDELKQKKYEEQVEQREQLIAANKGNPDFIAPPELPEPVKKNKGGNRKRRKSVQLTVPTSYTIFDPTKVVPVGQLMFGKERFAYVATREEDEAFSKVMVGNVVDDTVLRLLERKYTPNGQDKKMCAELGVDDSLLWLFNRDAIWRYTATRAQYERFAVPRMRSVIPILEMKDHLRNSDRATLIGNTNFIVVITKGSDKLPAKPAEIENLQSQARMVARLPVLVGDHRLHVEIVAPTMDNTLQDSRWQVLDSRLVFTALKTFTPLTQGGASAGSGVKEMSMIVSKGLMNHRHMIVRSLEKEIFAVMLQRNPDLTEFPTLTFSPRRITLDFQADIIGQVLKLRDRGDISRETTLEELDYDQDTEVMRRAIERLVYDEVFESQTPFSSPATNPYGTSALPPGFVPAAPGGAPPAPAAPPAKTAAPVPAKKAAKKVAKKAAPAATKPGSNVGPKGQSRTEGGRPTGARTAKKTP